ncbi:MAG: STT3 domain-containing protein [Candidatus Pacearchaeota archaeon]
MDEDNIIEKRKEKLMAILKKRWLWTSVLLIIALILGAYIRTLPMQDHNPNTPGLQPGLWDYTKNDWTLGPDLDPWLFTRIAKETIEQGSMPKKDMFRNVPLGFDNTKELQMVTYMIIFTYKIISIFGYNNIMLAAVLMPVIFFLLTIIAFFLFVREIFITNQDEKNKTKANIIALISTYFMIVIPVFLSRTIAGIPEKESVGFFFMFLTFYFIIKAWKFSSIKFYILFGVLSGIATALMALTWGGSSYIWVTVSVSYFIAFLLNKVHFKEILIYVSWLITSLSILFTFTTRYSILSFLTNSVTGLVTLVLFIIVFNFLFSKLKISDTLKQKYKLPKNVFSVIIFMILILTITVIFLGPSFIIDKFNSVYQMMFKPLTGRWIITVAENRQPYYSEWGSDFGPYIKQLPKFPIMFWLFFTGSVFLLFITLSEKIKKKDALILTIIYILFFFGLVFSRYEPHPHLLDGEGIISKILYIGGALLIIFGFIFYYIKYEKEGDKSFEQINFNIILLFVLFILCLFTARSAIRLVMVLGPVAPIFLSYLIVEGIYRFLKSNEETIKIIIGSFTILVIILSVFTFYSYYQTITAQAYSFVPSPYNIQWQEAMKWVREKTPKDAVFLHWWDYGYWVQAIGERATVTDGGNAIVYWNYLTGRYVLTGDNQNDSLEFSYNHNVSYLLIDSSDIGKYGAFSSIGSDINYDRYSWIGIFLMNEKQTQETKNQTILFYFSENDIGIALDEDLTFKENNKEIILPAGRTRVGLIILPIENINGSQRFNQPMIVMEYNRVVHKIPMRYLNIEDKMIDFKSGIEACAFIFPRLESDGQRVSENKIGAAMFISPRLLRGFLAQKYIMNDPFNKFPNFKIAHVEPSPLIKSLNSQGMNLPDFVYFNGLHGPIKIWKLEYTGNERIREEYLDIDSNKYLNWSLV